VLTRRQLLARGGALAATFALPPLPLFSGPPSVRKLIDIGPGGVIAPGSPQDYRAYANRALFAETQTGWVRMWADWPSLQPDGAFAVDDPRSPGFGSLTALDEQIRLARTDGLRVMLLPYRHPLWLADDEYRVPAEGYPLDGAWSRFFEFLLTRYAGSVDAFELVNEPNHQLRPQAGVERAVAQLMQTAQSVSARHGHPRLLLAPSAADVKDVADFTSSLLDALDAIGYEAHAKQGWSHHNYSDVEGRTTARIDAVRAALAGRWKGRSDVYVTEGGARLERMRALYPLEDPLAAQAACLEAAWASHSRAGVGMLAQYLLYADPNYDCGLLEPAPATVKRPAYWAWKSFPRRA